MTRVRFWVRATLGSLGFVLAVVWYLALRILPLPMARRRKSFARMLSRLCCRPVGVRVRVIGGERIERHRPCIYACNHQSQIDYPIIGGIYPGNALMMASQIGDWPVMGRIYRSSDSITIDRDVPLRAAASLDRAERAIREKNLSIWMFVEGTRGRERGRLGRFKRGAFRLASRTGVPIVPIVVSPLKPETDLRGRRLSPHEVVVRVLDPVWASDGDDAEDVLREEVRGLMQQELAGYDRPPVDGPGAEAGGGRGRPQKMRAPAG